uniref:Uncharacterized protein n=1 Tax=Glossina pallidipes TaxID=7398 RepID=A0A1A9Z1X7_GLOPL
MIIENNSSANVPSNSNNESLVYNSFNGSSPGTTTLMVQVLYDSPASLKASQVYVPESSGKISAICNLYILASFVYWKSLLGLISLLLCSQTTSNCLAPIIRQAKTTASPSFTNRDSRWLTIFGGLSLLMCRFAELFSKATKNIKKRKHVTAEYLNFLFKHIQQINNWYFGPADWL